MRHNENPREFLFLLEERSGIFCVYECVQKMYFSVCSYTCINELGFQRDGKSLGFWASNRGESALLAHDFPVESLVCYTFCDRCRWKGGVCFRNTPFPVAAEQADFGAPRALNSGFVTQTKSGCSGVGGAAQ